MNGRAPEQSEAGFQAVVMDIARFNRWRVFHVHDSRRQVAPGRFVGDKDAAGFPDLVLVRPGELLVRELKTDTGTVAPEQQAWLDALAQAGVDVGVWRPRDWPTIEATLGRRPCA